MAQCDWDPSKHGGKPCPVHGASGTENNTGHKLRINGGKYQVKYSDSSDYEDTDKETFDHLRETASQDFDENVEDDFGFDEGYYSPSYEEGDHVNINGTEGIIASVNPQGGYLVVDKNGQEIGEFDEEDFDEMNPTNSPTYTATDVHRLMKMAEKDGHKLSEEEAKNLLYQSYNPRYSLEDFYKELDWDDDNYMPDDELGYGQTHNFLVDKNKEMQSKPSIDYGEIERRKQNEEPKDEMGVYLDKQIDPKVAEKIRKTGSEINNKLSLENAIKSADDDVLDSQFGKDTPERKLAGTIKNNPNSEIPHKPVTMPKYHREQGHIVIDEGPHAGESYDSEEDYFNSVRSEKESENTEKLQQDFTNTIGKFIDSDGSDQELDAMIKNLRKNMSDEDIIKKLAMMFKGTIK